MVAEEFNYAGFWPRLAAGLIDLVILSILPVIWIAAAVMVFGLPTEVAHVSGFDQIPQMQEAIESQRAEQFSQQQRIAGWVSNAFSIVFVIGFWTWKGQTPGKMLFHIRIIRKDGLPIGLKESILRYIGQLIGAIFFFLGFAMIAWDRRRQGFHDKIAGTYVVKI